MGPSIDRCIMSYHTLFSIILSAIIHRPKNLNWLVQCVFCLSGVAMIRRSASCWRIELTNWNKKNITNLILNCSQGVINKNCYAPDSAVLSKLHSANLECHALCAKCHLVQRSSIPLYSYNSLRYHSVLPLWPPTRMLSIFGEQD